MKIRFLLHLIPLYSFINDLIEQTKAEVGEEVLKLTDEELREISKKLHK